MKCTGCVRQVTEHVRYLRSCENRGIVNRDGKPFTSSYILRMLRNPINKGTAVMGKYHFDFDSKRTIKNPKEKKIYP